MAGDLYWARALSAAAAADTADPLAAFRARFRLPPDVIYLDGNSLGPAPEAALRDLARAAGADWAEGLIRSWNAAGWFDLPGTLGDVLAPVIGADPGEVVVCDTTSANLYKAIHAALGLRPDRKALVAEGAGFPTDLYVAEGVRTTRPDLEIRLEGVDGPQIEGLLGPDVAVLVVNQVDYRTGRKRDVAALTAAAHDAGAVVVWDLCHSAGVMEVGLGAAGADLAVGCSYKFLNGGPGGPGWIYAARRHHPALGHPLSGWWGHAQPFDFSPSYVADPGIRRFLCGTPPILSLRAAEAGLRLAAEADLAAVRAKSVALGERFIALVEDSCAGHGITLLSPRAADERGSQVSLTHPEGYAIVQALIARGVIGDFRAPDVMRFGFGPLYLRHIDVVQAVRHLGEVLETGAWRAEAYKVRTAVT